MSKVEPRETGDRMLMRDSSDALVSDALVSEARATDPRATDTIGIVPFRHTGPGQRRRWLSEPVAGEEGQVPNRYEVRESEKGRYLRCKEAPGINVTLDRAYSFTEAEARKLGERVILLDGAGQFGPLLDNAKRLYNLDHHESCLRAFTLATCEQALVLVLKGLELEKGDWRVLANEPDLDTIFALWILLNHRRIKELRPEARDLIAPLVRLEGSIDANGFEVAELCSGLPRALFERTKTTLDQLHARELELKKSGAWNDADFAGYASEMLFEIDKIVYRPSDFGDFASVEEEYAHVEIGHDRVAVVCRDSSGIYDVEKRLKKTWGERLGIIALEKGEGHYTLRRTASLSAIDLGVAYEKLNVIDPVVDGRPPEKKWGGSDEIGGSPRPGGTGLLPSEVAKILRLSYRPPNAIKQAKNVLTLLLSTLGLISGAVLVLLGWRLYHGFHEHEPQLGFNGPLELGVAAMILGVGAVVLTRTFAGHRVWLFGWRRPAGRDWLLLVPLVLAAGAVGAAWVPAGWSFTPAGVAAAAGATVLAVVALELCFRGVAHGLLILDSPVQGVRGRWFFSRSTLISALLYTLLTVPATWFWLESTPWVVGGSASLPALALGALHAGLALGMIRERSLSLVPGILAQLAASALQAALALWFAG